MQLVEGVLVRSESLFGLSFTALLSSRKIVTGFWVNLLCGLLPHIHCPYYEPLLWFMMYIYQVSTNTLCLLAHKEHEATARIKQFYFFPASNNKEHKDQFYFFQALLSSNIPISYLKLARMCNCFIIKLLYYLQKQIEEGSTTLIAKGSFLNSCLFILLCNNLNVTFFNLPWSLL